MGTVRFTRENIDEALLMLDQGMSKDQVIKKLGCSINTLNVWIRQEKAQIKKANKKIDTSFQRAQTENTHLKATLKYVISILNTALLNLQK